MVADSDGKTLTAVVICEGNVDDPDFPDKLNALVGQLTTLTKNVETDSDEELKVAKVRYLIFFFLNFVKHFLSLSYLRLNHGIVFV